MRIVLYKHLHIQFVFLSWLTTYYLQCRCGVTDSNTCAKPIHFTLNHDRSPGGRRAGISKTQFGTRASYYRYDI
ncbi:hypothetical protein DFH07DRAFT_828197 [Mycena maculata]|uniref:Secreted protein n=1 Tax=Mycena maculata TaxID=230809 RepID=A0AAD7ITL5_9AGAR|nr:hypothetical protein DFH07DRAFT_828197 [Mycena maculata]